MKKIIPRDGTRFFYYPFSALEFNVHVRESLHELTINDNTILHDLFFYSISVMCVFVYQREYPILTVLHVQCCISNMQFVVNDWYTCYHRDRFFSELYISLNIDTQAIIFRPPTHVPNRFDHGWHTLFALRVHRSSLPPMIKPILRLQVYINMLC